MMRDKDEERTVRDVDVDEDVAWEVKREQRS